MVGDDMKTLVITCYQPNPPIVYLSQVVTNHVKFVNFMVFENLTYKIGTAFLLRTILHNVKTLVELIFNKKYWFMVFRENNVEFFLTVPLTILCSSLDITLI